MQVSSSDKCERTIVLTVSFFFAKGQINEECLLAMLKSEKDRVWQAPETLCWQEAWLVMLLCNGFQESCRCQESCAKH